MKKRKIIGTGTTLAIGTFLGMMFAPKKGEEFRKDVKDTITKTGEKVKKVSNSSIKDNLKDALEAINKKLDDLEFEKEKKSFNKKSNAIKDEIDDIIKAAHELKDDILVNTATKLKEQAQEKIECILKKLNEKQDQE